MIKKNTDIASLNYKGLKISANSFYIALISIILGFILTVSAMVLFFKYKMTQLQLQKKQNTIEQKNK